MQVRRKKTKQIFPPRAKTTPPILEMRVLGSDPDVPVSELLFELPIQEMLYELQEPNRGQEPEPFRSALKRVNSYGSFLGLESPLDL